MCSGEPYTAGSISDYARQSANDKNGFQYRFGDQRTMNFMSQGNAKQKIVNKVQFFKWFSGQMKILLSGK